MTSPKNYIDIGHLGDSILWIWRRGKLLTATSKGGKTHEKLWGRSAMRDWRGRYEMDTGRLSISPPFSQRHKSAPAWLIDALEVEFGSGGEKWEFNPGKVAKRIK